MMQHRSIELDHVKQAMRDPDSLEDAHEGVLKARKQIGMKEIEVVYCTERTIGRKEEYLIITAYYL
ncbi:MAG: hypothetical protein WD874_00915 [Parcubacteria group bacterium]